MTDSIIKDSPLPEEAKSAIEKLTSSLSANQAAWVSGYFAHIANNATEGTASSGKKVPLTILFGSESGNCETLANNIKKQYSKSGFAPKVVDMFDAKMADLAKAEYLIVVISTWGEGDPPERAEEFYKTFINDNATSFANTQFGILALGDSSYVDFCEMGIKFDQHLEKQGGKRFIERIDCDVDFDDPAKKWIDGALDKLVEIAKPVVSKGEVLDFPTFGTEKKYDKNNPFEAEVSELVLLNGTGTSKETYHLEISLEGSGLKYTPGDSIALIPRNDQAMVQEILETLGFNGSEQIEGKALKDYLAEGLDINTLTRNIVKKYVAITGNPTLKALAEDKDLSNIQEYVYGREIIDILKEHKSDKITPENFVGMLRKLPPRFYSISSSMAEVEDEVHLTVAAVRYNSKGRDRKGVASCFIADRMKAGDKVKLYNQPHKTFKLPKDNKTKIIMVGPGTGIAPFRSFMQQRSAEGAKGNSWLFFGDQKYNYDFLYQLEWQDYMKDGTLERINVAFSRDQKKKIYVQNRMWEQREDLFKWLEEGANFYVCGDKDRMAKDVHETLLKVIADQGKLSPEQAEEYLVKMKKESRYLRDVY